MLIAFITTILVSLSFEQKVTYTFPEFPYKETNKNVSSTIQFIGIFGINSYCYRR
jgi:hypothetical protein